MLQASKVPDQANSVLSNISVSYVTSQKAPDLANSVQINISVSYVTSQ